MGEKISQERLVRIIVDKFVDGYNVQEIKEYLFDHYEVVLPAKTIENILEENSKLVEIRRGLKVKSMKEDFYESLKRLRMLVGKIEEKLDSMNDKQLSRNLIMLLEQYRQTIKDMETVKGNLLSEGASIDVVSFKQTLKKVLPEILKELEKEQAIIIKDKKRVLEVI